MNGKRNTKDKLFNCLKEPRPLNNKCLVYKKIYKATVTSQKATKEYLGSMGNSFKQRFRNHKSSFNNTNKNIQQKWQTTIGIKKIITYRL